MHPPLSLSLQVPTLGRVSLSVAWRPIEPRLVEPGTQHVHHDTGTGLKAVDFGGTSDPYVKLSCGEEQHVSSYVASSLNPTWHEDFTFRGTLRSLRTLSIQAMDHNNLTSDRPLGDATLDMSALQHGDMHSLTEGLSMKGTVSVQAVWAPA
jgi:Ca2+-dependent lipid-binding protein